MKTKTQNQLPKSDWSSEEVFGLVVVAVLVCAAMVAYWIFEEDLPRVWWGLALPFGIMAGLMGIAFALRSHYGKGSLLGSRFINIAGSLYFLFLSTTHPFRGSTGSIALAIISYALGLSMGAIAGALISRIEEKHIVGDRLTWANSRNAKDQLIALAPFGGVIALFFMFDVLYPVLNGMQVFAGFFLCMTLHSLVWTYLYEKRNGIRIVIER